ncbi:MAG TPA: L-threonylcarbamoyladenylate synthase [Acidiferrobacteraceae bacterium]|nr:L-threonylcarbamoyladenylate synthase [Acidiferrobacteraceae bacterium]
MRYDPRSVRQAARVLRRGGVVGYPTESCFGLGCDPARPAAVRRLLRLKRRPQRKGLILIGDNAEALARYGVLTPAIQASWPGAVTWLVPGSRRAAPWIRGRHPAVALRVPDHAGARALAQAAHTAVVSTSANRAGDRAARSGRELRRRFGRELDAVVTGQIGRYRFPSRIMDAATGRRLR